MNGRQKRTYLVYSRGIPLQELSPGGLYLDPANPLDGERKRFCCPLGPAEMQKWLLEPDIDEPCSLRFNASREWLLSAGLVGIVGARVRLTQAQEVSVAGSQGRRLQIRNPENFLNKVVLSSSEARGWLQDQLSISRKMYYSRKLVPGAARSPKVWLLTGVQCISNANVMSTSLQSTKGALKFATTSPDPVAATVQIATHMSGVKFAGQTGASLSSSKDMFYHHRDERVWAAQFTPLKVNYSVAGETSNQAETLPDFIMLRDLQDLGNAGVRGESDDGDVANHKESAHVVGMDTENEELWTQDPDSLLEEMEDIDWGRVENYLDQLNEQIED